MALTPDDVVHKRFETTRFRDGYDQDEVDDFLDEVVTELRRLTEENDALRAENAMLRSGGEVAAPVVQAPVDTAELDGLRAENEQLKQQLAERAAAPAEVPAEPQQQQEEQPAPIAEVPAPAAAGSTEANSLIALATRLHDEHVAAGEQRRDELIAAAEAAAQQIEDEAQQRKVVLEQEFDDQKGKLEQQKTALEAKIDELKSFERDYRLKLRGYIESQLRDLDRSSSLAFGGQGGS